MTTLLAPTWTGGRKPLDTEAAEAARTAAYWAWLSEAAPDLADTAPEAMAFADGQRWVQLRSAADADFEALHMAHSIGHSWDKYSGFGDIFGLRSADGLPQATILVSKGAVVHAREHENARLSEANQAALEALAARMGWTVKADPLPFDYLTQTGETAPNTRLKYLRRAADGHKSFATIVLDGRLSETQVHDLASGLLDGKRFRPTDVGLADLPGAEGELHEVLSVRYVHDAPTETMDANALHAAWTAAAAAGWSHTAPALRR